MLEKSRPIRYKTYDSYEECIKYFYKALLEYNAIIDKQTETYIGYHYDAHFFQKLYLNPEITYIGLFIKIK